MRRQRQPARRGSVGHEKKLIQTKRKAKRFLPNGLTGLLQPVFQAFGDKCVIIQMTIRTVDAVDFL